MKLPRYEEFKVNFIELTYLSNKTRSKNAIKYILSKQLGDAISCLNINHKLLTIEHYIPESAIKSGTPPEIVGCIGNLLLIDESTNNNILKDSSIESKYKTLVEKGYPLKQTYISSPKWGESEIKSRTESIANQLYNSMSLI